MPEQQVHYLTTDTRDEVIDEAIPMTAHDMYPGDFPGYVGMSGQNLESDGFNGNALAGSYGGEYVDRVSFGEHGLVGTNSSSEYGPVEPNQVCNHQMTGEIAKIPRKIDTGHGDVGLYDHNSYTALQIIDQLAADPTDQASLAILLGAGV